MTETNVASCLDLIEQTFEREAEHIVRGEMAEIGALARTKVEHLETLYKAIEAGALRGQPSALINRVEKLQATALEHDRHLQAMRFGLSRMIERIERLQSDTNVGSYNQYGARVQFSNSRGRFESKA